VAVPGRANSTGSGHGRACLCPRTFGTRRKHGYLTPPDTAETLPAVGRRRDNQDIDAPASGARTTTPATFYVADILVAGSVCWTCDVATRLSAVGGDSPRSVQRYALDALGTCRAGVSAPAHLDVAARPGMEQLHVFTCATTSPHLPTYPHRRAAFTARYLPARGYSPTGPHLAPTHLTHVLRNMATHQAAWTRTTSPASIAISPSSMNVFCFLQRRRQTDDAFSLATHSSPLPHAHHAPLPHRISLTNAR